MKLLMLLVAANLAFLCSSAQNKKSSDSTNIQVVEAACGQCKMGLKASGCDLAVRINGKAYFVDGTNINDHGDAHAEDGFCNAVRKAEVKGEIVGDRYKVSYFKLLKEPVKKD